MGFIEKMQTENRHAIQTPPNELTQSGKRYLFVDVETTGVNADGGDRIVEFAALEMIDRKLTGNQLHLYINPECPVGETAHIHGLTDDFLAEKPVFTDIGQQIADFIEGAGIIAHNASFDVRFLDAEFRRIALTPLSESESEVIDTLALARQKHPAQKNNLDALAKRYNVTERDRTFHGALLDTQILADVFLAMTGGQVSLLSDSKQSSQANISHAQLSSSITQQLMIIEACKDEQELHQEWIQIHGNPSKKPEALWHSLSLHNPDQSNNQTDRTAE